MEENEENNMEENLLKQRKEMLTKLIHDPAYVPMKAKEIAILLDIPKRKQEELLQVLTILVDEGAIGISKKGKYGRPELFSVTGIFSGHPKGFGFVAVEGMEQDIFIPAEKTGGALHGDRVRLTVEQEPKGRRAEGAILKVLEHANREIIGYYQKSKNFGFVIPDNQKIAKDVFIPGGKDMGLLA